MACGRTAIGAGQQKHSAKGKGLQCRLQKRIGAAKSIEIDQIEMLLLEVGTAKQDLRRLLLQLHSHSCSFQGRQVAPQQIIPAFIGIIHRERDGSGRSPCSAQGFKPPTQRTNATPRHQIQPTAGPFSPLLQLPGSQQHRQVTGGTGIRPKKPVPQLQLRCTFAIVRDVLAQTSVDATALQTAAQADGRLSDWGDAALWQWQGLQSHWRVLGPSDGKPLVLLHGFGASSDHWRHNAAPLAAAGFQVYGLDLIGFGRSEQPGHQRQRPIDNRLWARQLTAFLEQVVQASAQQPAVLVGNSLGGLTALTAAVLRPELVAAVAAAPLPDPALMQPVPLRRPRFWRRLRRPFVVAAMRLLPLGLLVPVISRTALIRLGLQGAYHRSIRHDRELHQLIAAPARRPTAARALRAMSIGMALRPRGATAPALLERLAALPQAMPLLLLWGRQDRFVPLLIGERLQQQHAWLELEVIEGSGHCPHDETPEAFHQVLLSWLDRNLDAHIRC